MATFRRLCVVWVLGLGLCVHAMAQTLDLTLLHTNDVYEISPKRGKGGFAPLMTLLQQERARTTHHLTTFGGDLLSPSVMSDLTQGAQMIELMNAIGVDVASLGNHEFDFGLEVLKQRLAESRFTWLASNTLGPDGQPFGGAKATLLRQVGPLQIGFFALLTPETVHLSKPGAGVTFAPVIETAKAAVKTLKEQGADVIIALTHLSIAQDRELARQIQDLQVILGGHDHDPIVFYEGGKLIIKAGYDAHYLAVVDLRIDKRKVKDATRVSVLPQWRFVSTSGVAPEAQIARLVETHEKSLDQALGVAVGTTSVPLDSRRSTVRVQESNLGNLIADAMRAALAAEVGLMNGGGIRGDRTYDAGTTLTRKDILTELPFGNVTVLLALNGADLWAALEHGVSQVEAKAGRFPQVSGLHFSYDAQRPPGSRILEVTVGGQPLDKQRVYTVATNDFIAAGGDGYAVLKQGKQIIDASGGTLMASQVIEYITKQGTIAPRVEGRITAK